jgi:hypothetical protein
MGGITINGIPLDEYLKMRDASEKDLEIDEDIKERTKRLAAIQTKTRYEADTKKVARRVTFLTDRQIRKEYGIMAKQFQTMAENVLWVLINRSPITLAEIANELQVGDKKNSCSAALATIYKSLGPANGYCMLEREKYRNGHRYTWTDTEADVQRAHDLMKKSLRDMRKEKKEPKAETKEPHRSLAEACAEHAAHTLIGPSDKKKDAISEVVEHAVEHALGLKVDVSGKIEIVFKIGG